MYAGSMEGVSVLFGCSIWFYVHNTQLLTRIHIMPYMLYTAYISMYFYIFTV